jgi:hypothetical protein
MRTNGTLGRVWWGVVFGFLLTQTAAADLIPPGHKGVEHLLVFEKSPALEQHRLVAAPVSGFRGTTEVRAGQRFSFSSKYGTRFYLIPKEVTSLPEYDRDLYSQWPSVAPPVNEVASVPIVSPVNSVLTTLRLADVTSGQPQIEVVADQEMGDNNRAVSWKSHVWRPLVLIPVGIAVLLTTLFILRRAKVGKP